MNVIRWLLLNKYRHIDQHLDVVLDSMDGPLVARVHRRAEAAVRLQAIRAILYGIIILPAYATLITGLLDTVGVVSGLERAVTVLASIAVAVAVLAVIALFLVQRSLGILEADIYLFSMVLVSDRPRRGLPPIAEGFGRTGQDAEVEQPLDRHAPNDDHARVPRE